MKITMKPTQWSEIGACRATYDVPKRTPPPDSRTAEETRPETGSASSIDRISHVDNRSRSPSRSWPITQYDEWPTECLNEQGPSWGPDDTPWHTLGHTYVSLRNRWPQAEQMSNLSAWAGLVRGKVNREEGGERVDAQDGLVKERALGKIFPTL